MLNSAPTIFKSSLLGTWLNLALLQKYWPVDSFKQIMLRTFIMLFV